MRAFIYLIFYSISVISIIVSCVVTYFLVLLFTKPLLPLLTNLEQSSQLMKDYGVTGIFLFCIPLFIFLFQVMQDFNYHIIHKLGFWAKAIPKFSRRGFTIPDFYNLSVHSHSLQEKAKKSKYWFRLFAISSWVFSTIMIELFLVCYGLIENKYHVNLHPVIVFTLIMLILYLFFWVWERLQKKLQTEIAYVENEREFLCKKEQKT